MTNIQLRKELEKATELMLNCKDQVGDMKSAVDKMYRIYCDFSEINTNNQNDEAIFLDSGKAISAAEAAHCLLEMKRTTKFVRGINKAINSVLKNKKTVDILYAGSGPYASLITPIFTIFNSNQLKVDLIDINESSLKSAKTVIEGLGFETFVNNYLCEDACKIKLDKEYDIVISETMQAALKNEPQVSIMKNLLNQLPDDTIFIPEEITIDLCTKQNGIWDSVLCREINAKWNLIDTILKVNKETIRNNFQPKTLTVDLSKMNIKLLPFYDTRIKIYEDESLDRNDCSLNQLIFLKDIPNSHSLEIKFQYEISGTPKIVHKIRNTKAHKAQYSN